LTDPKWYSRLNDDIEGIIERACGLYPRADRALVVAAVARAIHRRASETDIDCAWLSIMFESCAVTASETRVASLAEVSESIHPSRGDAEDVAEDICMMRTPFGEASPTIAIRSGVHVAWARFVSHLDSRDRALLAADAVHYA
jgi:hypothetical protein